MYGKSYRCKYSGSMFGKGALFFTVWGYACDNARKGTVEINPEFLAAIIGHTTPEEVQQKLDELCEPDPKSRSPEEDGKRLIREGQFLYRVVNHGKYNKIRDEDHRREYMRSYMRGKRNLSGGSDAGKVSNNECSVKKSGMGTDHRTNPLPAQNIYNAYPRKVARPAALRAIEKALKRMSIAEEGVSAYGKLLKLTQQYSDARMQQEPGLTPHPATWFNQERYNDDPATWKDRDSSKRQAKLPAPSGAAYRPLPPPREVSEEELQKAREIAKLEVEKLKNQYAKTA